MKNTQSIEKRECYLSPAITLIEFSCEKGIAASAEYNPADYTSTGGLEYGEEHNL